MYFLIDGHKFILFARENANSFMVGAISETNFVRGERRSLISLQMCFMSWLYELLAVVFALMSSFLGKQIQEFKIPNIHFPDVIIMFIVIPFIHLLNDEEIKNIIFEQGWIEGVKYVLGIYTEPSLGRDSRNPRSIQNSMYSRPIPQKSLSSEIPKLTSSQRRLIYRKCKSAIDIVSNEVLIVPKEKIYLQRQHSLREDVFQGSSEHLNVKKVSFLRRTLVTSSSEKLTHEIQKITSDQGSQSSLSTIYLYN